MKEKTHNKQNIPDVSIAVLNWNTSDILGEALESIVTTTGNISYEVFVIDNASTDSGFANIDNKFKEDSRFSFVQNKENVGVSALNVMLEIAHGKYILSFEAGARLRPNTLQNLFSFMEEHPKAGAATANLLNQDGSLQLYYRRTLTPFLFFFTTLYGRFIDKYFLGLRYFKYHRYVNLDTSRNSEVEQPTVSCLILRREAIGEYIIDDDLTFYFMDVDISKRVYDAGYKIYLVSEAFAVHLRSVSYTRTVNKWKQQKYYQGLSIYLRKHYPKHFPLLQIILWSDRFLRAVLMRIIGREPLR